MKQLGKITRFLVFYGVFFWAPKTTRQWNAVSINPWWHHGAIWIPSTRGNSRFFWCQKFRELNYLVTNMNKQYYISVWIFTVSRHSSQCFHGMINAYTFRFLPQRRWCRFNPCVFFHGGYVWYFIWFDLGVSFLHQTGGQGETGCGDVAKYIFVTFGVLHFRQAKPRWPDPPKKLR